MNQLYRDEKDAKIAATKSNARNPIVYRHPETRDPHGLYHYHGWTEKGKEIPESCVVISRKEAGQWINIY